MEETRKLLLSEKISCFAGCCDDDLIVLYIRATTYPHWLKELPLHDNLKDK